MSPALARTDEAKDWECSFYKTNSRKPCEICNLSFASVRKIRDLE